METTKKASAAFNESADDTNKWFNETSQAMIDLYRKQVELRARFYNNFFNSFFKEGRGSDGESPNPLMNFYTQMFDYNKKLLNSSQKFFEDIFNSTEGSGEGTENRRERNGGRTSGRENTHHEEEESSSAKRHTKGHVTYSSHK